MEILQGSSRAERIRTKILNDILYLEQSHRIHPDEHDRPGNSRRDYRKQLTTVANDTNDAEYQGGGKREHYQQSSKDRERIASAGLA